MVLMSWFILDCIMLVNHKERGGGGAERDRERERERKRERDNW